MNPRGLIVSIDRETTLIQIKTAAAFGCATRADAVQHADAAGLLMGADVELVRAGRVEELNDELDAAQARLEDRARKVDEEWARAEYATRRAKIAEAQNAMLLDALHADHDHPIRAILAERLRQVTGEGYTPARDDSYTARELARAASAYVLATTHVNHFAAPFWPSSWSPAQFKPRDAKANLIRAGALIVAELERLARAELVETAEAIVAADAAPPAAEPAAPDAPSTEHSPVRLRCGDKVRLDDEDLIVAFADYDTGELAWIGWPGGVAKIADATLLRAATEEQHAAWVQRFRDAAASDFRRDRVLALYGAVAEDVDAPAPEQQP